MKRIFSRLYTASANPSMTEVIVRGFALLMFPIFMLQVLGWAFNSHSGIGLILAFVLGLGTIYAVIMLAVAFMKAFNNYVEAVVSKKIDD